VHLTVLRFSGSKILWYILPYLLIYSARLDVRLLVMSLMPAAESKTSPSSLMKKWRQEVFLLYLVRFSFAQVAAVEDSKPKILFSPGGISLAGAGYPLSAPFASLVFTIRTSASSGLIQNLRPAAGMSARNRGGNERRNMRAELGRNSRVLRVRILAIS
jgi:hypothetical protein